MQFSCGVPQGSVIGPLLWAYYHLFYDGLMCLELHTCVQIYRFADDIAILGSYPRASRGGDQPSACESR